MFVVFVSLIKINSSAQRSLVEERLKYVASWDEGNESREIKKERKKMHLREG